MWFSAHLALKGIRRFVLGAALGVQDFVFFLGFLRCFVSKTCLVFLGTNE